MNTKVFYLTPVMRFSILLTVSILIAKFSYCSLSTLYWLILTLASFLCAIVFKKIISQQCIAIYFCVFCMGCSLTSHEIDNQAETLQVESYEELSSFDRTLLEVQDFRQRIEQTLQKLQIEGQDYAVITAMALGDKSSLDKETKDAYSIAGTSHVLAVSGLHIGIIFQLFILLLGNRKKSILTIFLSNIAIWSYVMLIGMPTSAIRSAMMISIYCFATLAQKEALSLNTLCLTYLIMLLASPLSLFDISFQMSFMAVFSILVFYPLIVDVLHPINRVVRWVWSLLSVSIAAQIGTVPLIAYYFGRISCYSIITSMVAIPSATVILYLCALLFILVPFTWISWMEETAMCLSGMIAKVLISISQFSNTFYQLISTLPGASIENIKLNLPIVILIYIIIFAGFTLFKRVIHVNN